MSTILIILGVLIVLYVVKVLSRGFNVDKDAARSRADIKSLKPKPNDKLVIVRNISYEELKATVAEVCGLYNKESFQVLPTLVKIANEEFAITFAYDVNFEIYCYFVNFLCNLIDLKRKPDIIAWTTTYDGDMWITDKSVNKKVMLFVPEDDQEHDNVYLTTEDNIGYKLGFSEEESMQLLDTPVRRYIKPVVDIIRLAGKPTEEIQ